MSKVFAFLADGLEEVECLAVVDVLRRAGAEVTLVSVTGSREITGSHHIHFQADALFDETAAEEADVLFLPGGMPGTNTLKAHEGLKNAICKANKQGRRIAAICAAPSVFSGLGFLKDKKATSYPSFMEVIAKDGAQTSEDSVVTDGNITTSHSKRTWICLRSGDRTDPSADGTSACTDGKGFHPVRPGIRNIDYHIKISNRSKKDCTDKKCGLFF